MQHHDPEKWKKKFKMLFEREKIIAFGKTSSPMIDLKKLNFNAQAANIETDPSPRALRLLGKEVLQLAKFWVLFLTLAKVEKLTKGIEDLKKWNVEDSEENR